MATKSLIFCWCAERGWRRQPRDGHPGGRGHGGAQRGHQPHLRLQDTHLRHHKGLLFFIFYFLFFIFTFLFFVCFVGSLGEGGQTCPLKVCNLIFLTCSLCMFSSIYFLLTVFIRMQCSFLCPTVIKLMTVRCIVILIAVCKFNLIFFLCKTSEKFKTVQYVQQCKYLNRF